MQNEVWFPIPKFPTYEINEALGVRHKVFRKIKSCFMDDGYLKMNIDYLGKKHKPYLHQLVAWTWVPNPDNKPEIHHIDGDKLNNYPTNLKWVTKKEHRLLSMELGQIPQKITHEEVIEIRNNYSPEKEQELARKYGVHKNTIYAIAIGKGREYVEGGKIHPPKDLTKKVVNIKTGEIFVSSSEVALLMGIKPKELRRQLNGERYNNTNYRYLGEEHLSKLKPKKVKIIPFVSHSFGVVVSKKELMRSKNPFAKWKKVIQYDLSGNKLAEFRSIREAARSTGAKDHKALQKLLNGKRNKTYKKFIWKYA